MYFDELFVNTFRYVFEPLNEYKKYLTNISGNTTAINNNNCKINVNTKNESVSVTVQYDYDSDNYNVLNSMCDSLRFAFLPCRI